MESRGPIRYLAGLVLLTTFASLLSCAERATTGPCPGGGTILTCVGCHGRVSAEYRGELAGSVPDVHRQAGRECTYGPDLSQIHGDGSTYPTRHDVIDVPTCSGGHPDAGVEERGLASACVMDFRVGGNALQRARRSGGLCHTDESSLFLSEAFIQTQIQAGLMVTEEQQANSAITAGGVQ